MLRRSPKVAKCLPNPGRAGKRRSFDTMLAPALAGSADRWGWNGVVATIVVC